MKGFREIYTIEALDGGLNNKYEPNLIEATQSPDCLNVVFDDRGGMQTRNGYSKLNTASVGSFAGDGLFTARFNDATEILMGFWAGSAHNFNGASTFITVPSAMSVFTAGIRVDMCQYQNLAFFGDGYANPYKYNGTEWTRHGIPQPNSGPSDTSGTAGTSGPAAGDVNYKVSYVNSYAVEGDVSAATTTLTIAATATVSLTSIPLAPTSFGVGSRRLYRRSVGTSSSYKLVTTIADNTTTTYVDQTLDANLGAAAPTDNAVPPLWQYGISHQERLWLVSPTNPSYLYYSELGNPYVVKTTNYILIGDGDGEIITGLAVHANMVAIYKESSVWLIYQPDTTPGNWIRVKSNSRYGACSHYAQADFAGRRMFIGKRNTQISGFMALKGSDTEPNTIDLVATSVQSDTKSDAIEPEVFNFNYASIGKSCAIEYRNKLYFCVPYSSTTLNRVYVYDFQRRTEDKSGGAWVPFTYPVGFSSFCVYGGALYGQSSTAHGFVYKLAPSSTYSDDGTAINSYGWTKEFHGLDPDIENWKDFRIGNFIFEALGNYYMTVVFRVDGDTGVGTSVLADLSPGGSTWNSFNWGTGTWGTGTNRKKFRLFLGPLSGKRIQFKFSNQNTVSQGFHVYPLGSIQYNKRGIR